MNLLQIVLQEPVNTEKKDNHEKTMNRQSVWLP
jgi:hypothetical protein